MELIKRNSDYALRALVMMAANGPERAHQVGRLAEDAGVPEGFLRKTFQRLYRAGIVSSKRGPAGGFSFAKEPADITVLEVLEAIQGPVAVNKCFLGNGCGNKGTCKLRKSLAGVQQNIVDLFSDVTIETLAGQGTGG